MLATVAAADSAKVQKKSTAFLYIVKRNHTLCTLYINRRVHLCSTVLHEGVNNVGNTTLIVVFCKILLYHLVIVSEYIKIAIFKT